eukprot:scaffold111041_cov65-Attheya_sp.AAC.5
MQCPPVQTDSSYTATHNPFLPAPARLPPIGGLLPVNQTQNDKKGGHLAVRKEDGQLILHESACVLLRTSPRSKIL